MSVPATRDAMASPRLRYEPLRLETLDEFHELVHDEHVRRYLMDGEVFARGWSEARVRDSIDLFDRQGVGLWLAREVESGAVVGFCGFLVIAAVHPQPQLVYALFERFTSKGYATEMARASGAHARSQAAFGEIVASVDSVNHASVRVLEKLGFTRTATVSGTFGDTFTYRLTR
jgi:[ribosomal protein S5]-alanine N-acetyltransferase